MNNIVGAIDVARESGLYVTINGPDRALLLRGCSLVTPYRAGFEDARYAHVYANPFRVGSVKWMQYDQGNEDARKTKREEHNTCSIKGEWAED